MASTDKPDDEPPLDEWPDTQWTLIGDLRDGSAAQRQAALARLVVLYREPILQAILRNGHSPAEAEDLCQEFIRRTWAREQHGRIGLFTRATPEPSDPEGKPRRLRNLLYVALRRFLINAARDGRAIRRGGGAPHLPLSEEGLPIDGAAVHQAEDGTEAHFDRLWALNLFSDAYRSLADEFAAKGKSDLYAAIEPYLIGAESAPLQQDLAERLGLKPVTLRSTLSRAREGFRRHLRAAISRTVATPSEVDDELRHLCRVLGRLS